MQVLLFAYARVGKGQYGSWETVEELALSAKLAATIRLSNPLPIPLTKRQTHSARN